MEFEKRSSTKHIAHGKHGIFVIEQHRKLWWGRYASDYTAFKLPPRKSLKEAKLMCMKNAYWEDEKTTLVPVEQEIKVEEKKQGPQIEQTKLF